MSEFLNEVVETAVKGLAIRLIYAIDEGRIAHCSDVVDFTLEYLEELSKNEMCGDE